MQDYPTSPSTTTLVCKALPETSRAVSPTLTPREIVFNGISKNRFAFNFLGLSPEGTSMPARFILAPGSAQSAKRTSTSPLSSEPSGVLSAARSIP